MASDGAKFRAWREARGLSQEDAARLAGVARLTVSRAEKSGRLNAALSALMEGKSVEPEATPDPEPKAAKVAKPKAGADPIAEALQREPLFATTAAEAHAMRDELHRRALAKNKESNRSCVPLIPLCPVWQTVQPVNFLTKKAMGEPFKVNAAIPDPTVRAKGHPRGVATRSGALYDYETAALIRAPR